MSQLKTTKMSLEVQVKNETNKCSKIEKEFERIKTERAKFEAKAQAIEVEFSVRISFNISYLFLFYGLKLNTVKISSAKNHLKKLSNSLRKKSLI